MKRWFNSKILVIMMSMLMLVSCDKINIQITTEDSKTTGEASEDKETQDKGNNDTKKKEDNKIPENATMVDMEKLKKDYCVALSKDKDWCIDLDGDGTNEVIRYSTDLESDNEFTFTINGNKFHNKAIKNYNGPREMPSDNFGIVDLDNTDNKYQIALTNGGATAFGGGSDFFIYEDKKMEFIDNIESNYDAVKYNIDNTPGKFEHTIRIDAICTTQAIQYTQYDKTNKTFETVDDNYLKYTDWDMDMDGDLYDIKLLKDLTVYKSDDKTSSKLTIKAQDVILDKVRFVYKNKEENIVDSYWVFIKAQDGTEGWVYVENRQDGEKINGTSLNDYFENMYCG